MSFEKMLKQAKENDADAIMALLDLYQPLLTHAAVVDGRFDEDLYQELCTAFLRCIRLFRIR